MHGNGISNNFMPRQKYDYIGTEHHQNHQRSTPRTNNGAHVVPLLSNGHPSASQAISVNSLNPSNRFHQDVYQQPTNIAQEVNTQTFHQVQTSGVHQKRHTNFRYDHAKTISNAPNHRPDSKYNVWTPKVYNYGSDVFNLLEPTLNMATYTESSRQNAINKRHTRIDAAPNRHLYRRQTVFPQELESSTISPVKLQQNYRSNRQLHPSVQPPLIIPPHTNLLSQPPPVALSGLVATTKPRQTLPIPRSFVRFNHNYVLYHNNLNQQAAQSFR